MIFGIDIHGVIDTKPKLYSTLTHKLTSLGHEVHIITGAHITDQLLKQLKDLKITYTDIFSISDYHNGIGTEMTYKDSDNPLMDDDIWNKTKAEYCERVGIDLHIDDSPIYGKYFKSTIYIEIKNKY